MVICQTQKKKNEKYFSYRYRYTYGKPVEGKVTLRALKEYQYQSFGGLYANQPMIEQSLTLVSDRHRMYGSFVFLYTFRGTHVHLTKDKKYVLIH